MVGLEEAEIKKRTIRGANNPCVPKRLSVYRYDDRDRLWKKETPFGTLTYTYNNLSNLRTITSSNVDGAAVEYRYDTLNRLQYVIDANTGTTHACPK